MQWLSKVPWGIVGLIVGAVLKVVVPYLRAGLERVAETGTLASWPPFDWRYVAMFLAPILEFSVAFLTVPGLWVASLSWGFIISTAMAYAGTDIAKEVVKGAAAIYRVSRVGIAK